MYSKMSSLEIGSDDETIFEDEMELMFQCKESVPTDDDDI